MEALQIELPDDLTRDLERVIETGWIESSAEVVRAALREFLDSRRFELLEH